MNDRELLEFIAAQVGNLTTVVKNLSQDVEILKVGQKKLETILEGDINKKIDLALEGYKQNSEQLTRIENEVTKHDEFIMKRIK